MCHWRYEVYVGEGFDEPLASIPFQGGVRPNEESRERTLVKVRRQLSGYANAHPAARATLRIVEMSCNGPQREIRPYGPTGETRLLIGGWEGLPGEVEEVDGGLDGERDEETAVVVLRDGQQVAVFSDAAKALATIAGWREDERRGLVAYEVDLHGESLGQVWPAEPRRGPRVRQAADVELARRLSGQAPPPLAESMTDDDYDAVARFFARPAADPWRDVRAHFESFTDDVDAQAAALARLKTWAALASQDVAGGGRANDEQVELRASTLYSLRHALRALESSEGRLLVGRDDRWQPYPVATVDSLAAAQSAARSLEEQGESPAVYAIERHGQVGERLYPRDPTPYAVWSMTTANLIGEYSSADEAIAVCRQDPDDLVAFLDDGEQTTVVYDPHRLVAMTVAERRARLTRRGRESQEDDAHAFRAVEEDE